MNRICCGRLKQEYEVDIRERFSFIGTGVSSVNCWPRIDNFLVQIFNVNFLIFVINNYLNFVIRI